MREIFFKTVREDYTSVYARGILKKKYEVNKHYKFSPDLPAYVFCYEKVDLSNRQQRNKIYNNRYEKRGGNRVLVCCGELKIRRVPCFDIYDKEWNFQNTKNIQHTSCFTSTDFLVIDELDLPEEYNGIRPPENCPIGLSAVILTPALTEQFKELGI